MPPSSLVLSYIEDYAARDVAPFLESLRATGYVGDIVFFTFNVKADCEALFAAHGVRDIPVRRVDMKSAVQIPDWLATRLGVSSPIRPDAVLNTRLAALFESLGVGDSAVARRMAQYLWHCNSGRFFYYQQFLERHREYDRVLLADVRDVLFQRSPFSGVAADALYLFEEFPDTPLSRQVDNASWIRRLYGAAVLNEIGHFPIVCAGVMMGGHVHVLECVAQIARASVTNYIGWGTDQGTLNFLVRTGRLPATAVFPYGYGPAMHVGIAPRDTICTGERGRVLNREDEVCNIIHQYDRHPDLMTTLLRRDEEPSVEAPASG